jgi:hypothetical protein
MATLDQFTTAAVVAAGMESGQIGSALDALDAYVGAQPPSARRGALAEAKERLDAVGIFGSVCDALHQEIEVRLSTPASA